MAKKKIKLTEEEYNTRMVNELMRDYYDSENSLDLTESSASDTDILSVTELEACFVSTSHCKTIGIILDSYLIRNWNHMNLQEL